MRHLSRSSRTLLAALVAAGSITAVIGSTLTISGSPAVVGAAGPRVAPSVITPTATTPATATAQPTATATAQPTATATPPATATSTATARPTNTALPRVVVVPPAVLVAPSTGAPGGQVVITGSGFAPGEAVSIYLSGSTDWLARATVSNTGAVPPIPLTIPDTVAAGVHTLTMAGHTSHRSATMQVTVAPGAPTLSSVSIIASRGGVIGVRGARWAPNEAITLALGGVAMPVGVVWADAHGTLPFTVVALPASMAKGAYTLTATGAVSKLSAATGITLVEFAPVIKPEAHKGSSETRVTVTGFGFARLEHVALTLNGSAMSMSEAVLTSLNGGFSATFTVPNKQLHGANTLSATGDQSHVAASATLG